MPRVPRAKRDAGAVAKPDVARPARRIGPGVAPQRPAGVVVAEKMVSAVGSATGSFANGVRRFSRLFSAQVKDEAGRGDDGAELGVGDDVRPGHGRLPSPSGRSTYSRPSALKPPSRWPSASGGVAGAAASGADGGG